MRWLQISAMLFGHLTPGLRTKIPVFSDPAPGQSYATTYEHMDFWATQPLAKIFWAEILSWRPGVQWRMAVSWLWPRLIEFCSLVYIYIYIYIYMYTHTHTYYYTRIHICIYIYIYMLVDITITIMPYIFGVGVGRNYFGPVLSTPTMTTFTGTTRGTPHHPHSENMLRFV